MTYTYAETSSLKNRCVLVDDLFNKCTNFTFIIE